MFRSKEQFNYDNLVIASSVPVVTDEIVVAAEQNLQRGEIFELNVSNQAVAPSGVIDVTKAYGIMAEEVVTGVAETKTCVAYLMGEFDSNKIICPTGKTVADYKTTLRKLGMFVRNVIQA